MAFLFHLTVLTQNRRVVIPEYSFNGISVSFNSVWLNASHTDDTSRANKAAPLYSIFGVVMPPIGTHFSFGSTNFTFVNDSDSSHHRIYKTHPLATLLSSQKPINLPFSCAFFSFSDFKLRGTITSSYLFISRMRLNNFSHISIFSIFSSQPHFNLTMDWNTNRAVMVTPIITQRASHPSAIFASNHSPRNHGNVIFM